jgi:hypothetical protein
MLSEHTDPPDQAARPPGGGDYDSGPGVVKWERVPRLGIMAY